MRLPELGELFEERYEILSILGEGAFGCVYRARDSHLGRPVALKVLVPKEGEYSNLSAARFLREAHLLSALQDPHTIKLYEFGHSASGLLFMASEYVDGVDLRTTLIREGPLPEPVVLHILRQLLRSLAEAHGQGILHRDIKPANVLIHSYGDDRYRAKLLDFGLAKSVDVDATRLTGTGRITGTPRYMSPEQILCSDLSPCSDLYCLGLVAYEMLVGQPAIGGSEVKEVMVTQLKGDPMQVPPSVASPGTRQIIEQMAARPPEARPSTAGAVLAMLDGARTNPHRPPSGPVPIVQAPDRSGDQNVAQQRASVSLRGVAIASAIGGVLAVVAWFAMKPTAPPQRVDPVARAAAIKPAAAGPAPAESPPLEPDMPATQMSPGCGKSAKSGRQKLRASDKKAQVYVPTPYDADVAHPVILMLHDNNQKPAELFDEMALEAYADKYGLILLAPHAEEELVGHLWRQEVAEEAWQDAVSLQDVLCVDREAYFVLGHGLGGWGAELLGCHADGVRAVATAAFRRSPFQSCAGEPVPRIMMAPVQSGEIPVEGKFHDRGRQIVGRSSQRIPLSDHTDAVRENNSCSALGEPAEKYPDGRCFDYVCDAPLKVCKIDSGRHWPGHKYSNGRVMKPMKFEHQRVLINFFLAQLNQPGE